MILVHCIHENFFGQFVSTRFPSFEIVILKLSFSVCRERDFNTRFCLFLKLVNLFLCYSRPTCKDRQGRSTLEGW